MPFAAHRQQHCHHRDEHHGDRCYRHQQHQHQQGQRPRRVWDAHLPKELADDLWLWKPECPDSSPEAFIFPDAKGGFMDTGNYRRRVLHKLAKDLELPKLTFQVIRRTIATLAQKKGTVKTFRDFSGIPVRPQRPTCICKRSRRACKQPSTRLMLNSE